MLVAVVLSAPSFASPEPVAPLPDQEWVTEVNRNWRGVGVGYDNGLWGSSFAQGIKIDVPFGPGVGQFFGIRLRGLMVHDRPNAKFEPFFAGGGELFGRTPVWAGIVRVYGGGGVWYASTTGDDPNTGLMGGGHYGIEAALFERASFNVEVGGQSGINGDGPGLGASVMGGMTFYLGGLGG